ncbi:MAG: hypothetical protein A2Z14_02135 [Chloroflexi bacterium RBG_16_48_8]|nr:MAG: hypothetical protein A2Z14_02135 [Chloroflexi bacterium RBG_16_48_8]
MSKVLEKTLAECLEAMEENLSLEQCQERYPRYWEQLARLLPLASALREAPPVTPSFSFRRNARRRLISQLPPHKSSAKMTWNLPQLFNLFKVSNLQTLKPALQLLSILVVIFSLGTGVSAVYASGDSLPGDALYPIKIGVENLQLLLTFDDASEARLQIEFAQKRIGEMKALAEQGRYEDIQTAAEGYQSLLDATNETLRTMVLAGDQRTKEMGVLIEEALFYDALILSGLKEVVPTDTQGYLDVAIGASKSGNAIARQWVELYSSSPAGAVSQLPEVTQMGEDFGIPLPTDLVCWPSDLAANPPEGIPLCEEEQTPVPLPKNLILFCWPQEIPFDAPKDIPLCQAGEEPIPLPVDLNLVCWPREIPYDPPEGLPVCEEGQLPVPIPRDQDLSCWPTNIPYDPPQGVPLCDDGSYPTPAPEELPCWPPELPSDPPPGLPLCEPGQFPTPARDSSSLGGIRGGGAADLLNDIRSQLAQEYCWPAWLDQKPPLGMPICPSD